MAQFYLPFFCVLSAVVFASAQVGPGFIQRRPPIVPIRGPYVDPRIPFQSVVNPVIGDVRRAPEILYDRPILGECRYQLVEPDGAIRTVRYITDHTGFRSSIHRTPNVRGVVNSDILRK